ncbi:unnamed protein product [Phytophthora fragariaefolia]|uniref:Unnamed protein product n=1 Tax=Phytophthora fragariaefolia TaxID=1490495 RepID=A0A9W7CPU5_9STRA|nr:unnamed protein product [Phytophthora fragariaefolia]
MRSLAMCLLAALTVSARPMHANINYERYLAEYDDADADLKGWKEQFLATSTKNNWMPDFSEERSSVDVDEDLRQRIFMSKQDVLEAQAANPNANFSIMTPFSALTKEEFAAKVLNSYVRGNRTRTPDPATTAPTTTATTTTKRSLRQQEAYTFTSMQDMIDNLMKSVQAQMGGSWTIGTVKPAVEKTTTGGQTSTNSHWSQTSTSYWVQPTSNQWYKPATVAPTPATQAPVTPAPVPMTPAPPARVPVTQAPAPVTPVPTPVTQAPVTPAPVPVTQAPVTPAPAPVTPAPIPVTSAPIPVTAAPKTAAPKTPSPKPRTSAPVVEPVTKKRATPVHTEKATLRSANSVDWSATPCMSTVQSQGQCGSCWAFASVAAVESLQCIKGSRSGVNKYSEQQLVGCDRQNLGCGGGAPVYAFEYIQQNGLCSESAYPYTSRDGGSSTCSASCSKSKTGIVGYEKLEDGNEVGLIEALKSQPVVVAVASGNAAWKQYTGGVMSTCQTTEIDHAVLVVGYDDTSFKVRNSWGADWGEAGYVRMARSSSGKGTCGLLSDMSRPKM